MMFDFKDVAAASKDEQLRAWSLEQAIEMLRDSGESPEEIVESAKVVEDYIKKGVVSERLMHDEGTMDKVHEALRENGFLPDDIPNVVSSLQNRGILFRERTDT